MANSHQFNSKTTAAEVLAGKDLSDRTILVTGANTGIGFETARALANAGASILLACRNREKGKAAEGRIRTEIPSANVSSHALDLASLNNVREFCSNFPADSVDTIICNAGLVSPQFEFTEDGFETMVAVCHIGHFLLVRELLPLLLESDDPRVVMVSSESHRTPKKLNFDILPDKPDGFSPMKTYGQAKLCNALMARELDRRYADQGLTASYLHPGTMVSTNIGHDSRLISLIMKLASPFTKSAAQGAATSVYCATGEDRDSIRGNYFSNCQVAKPSTEAIDPDVAARLWELTNSWVEI